jgi:hypothetical protein
MATYTGRKLGLDPGTRTANQPNQGATREGVALQATGGPAPVIDRLGVHELTQLAALHAGRANETGATFLARLLAAKSVPLTGFLAAQGGRYAGRRFQVSAFYRQSERITLSGYAFNLADQPLRQVNLQFVGETVQDHFFGATTNLDGIYVAFLEVGDTYSAYAFNPKSGITYRLESMIEKPNQTDLVFRQVTKRGASGEGIFLQGDS